MQNCVFADAHDVLDKLEYLFDRPEKLQAIIDRGFELVHSRHTLKCRSQIFEWFRLQRNLKAGQRVIQNNPFDPLTITDTATSQIIPSGNMHLSVMEEGDTLLARKEYKRANELYLQGLHYYRYMPEALLRLAICALHRGMPKDALMSVSSHCAPLLKIARQRRLTRSSGPTSLSVIFCLGKLKEATMHASQFPQLRFPELDYTRAAVAVLDQRNGPQQFSAPLASHSRVSLHRLPRRTFEDWVEHMCALLNASGQLDFSNLLSAQLEAPGR